MTRQLWQHKTSGEQYIVDIDAQGRVVRSYGPCYYGDLNDSPDLDDWHLDDEAGEADWITDDWRLVR